ncbi:hypothetical protein BV22DRAFT_1052778 [Leucogyrophana mollusca]|uniref:Uncharacterized protein n=1 Tax=Leucogyrophana mollusca TaxID=85980 RepID=A0ACB8AWQ2_9AGAM|nr:hypothetical protein BV22DRAFT_1052778 [Leucogyrophana mollusca]
MCQILWLEMLNLKPRVDEVLEAARCSKICEALEWKRHQPERKHISRESPLGPDSSERMGCLDMWGEEPEPESGTEKDDGVYILNSRNGPKWYSSVSENPALLVQSWVKGLGEFFFKGATKDKETDAVRVLREMREAAKRTAFIAKLQEPLKKYGLASLILTITTPSMESAKTSELQAQSFRTYQWREALLLCLGKLTEGFAPEEIDQILAGQKECMEGDDVDVNPPSNRAFRRSKVRRLLELISEQGMVPMASKPHAIFFLCSLQNFQAACFDWLMWSVAHSRGIDLTEQDWAKYNLSPELRNILLLSKALRKKRNFWKSEAYLNRNCDRTCQSPKDASGTLTWTKTTFKT